MHSLEGTGSRVSPSSHSTFRQTLVECGVLLRDWTEAKISPIHKNGNAHLASNYRPVSLTCVLSKLMLHIICKHILNHLAAHNILTRFQHGFRKAHSCESQLLLTVNDLICSYDHKIQRDTAVLDFSCAFDTVPHDRLLSKLDHYGIRRHIKDWIILFLCDRQMWR